MTDVNGRNRLWLLAAVATVAATIGSFAGVVVVPGTAGAAVAPTGSVTFSYTGSDLHPRVGMGPS